MSVGSLKGDDLCIPMTALPVRDGLCSPSAPDKEDIDRHDEREIVHRNMHSPVSDGVLGNFVNKRWQRHTRLLLKTPSRESDDAQPLALINAVTAIYLRPILGQRA